MKINFSDHILKDKIPLLKKNGFDVTTELIEDIIINPEHIDKESDHPKIIASRKYDPKHILRVVYKIDGDIIKAITVYPAEEGRYY